MLAFDLWTATLIGWKSWCFSAAWYRRFLSAHLSANTVKNEVFLDKNPLLVSMAKGINPKASFLTKLSRSSEHPLLSQLARVPYFFLRPVNDSMTVSSSGQVRVTFTAAGDLSAQFGIKRSLGRLRLDSIKPSALQTGNKPADLQAWETKSLESLCRALRSLAEKQVRAWSP